MTGSGRFRSIALQHGHAGQRTTGTDPKPPFDFECANFCTTVTCWSRMAKTWCSRNASSDVCTVSVSMGPDRSTLVISAPRVPPGQGRTA
jgi:hypothetical protein